MKDWRTIGVVALAFVIVFALMICFLYQANNVPTSNQQASLGQSSMMPEIKFHYDSEKIQVNVYEVDKEKGIIKIEVITEKIQPSFCSTIKIEQYNDQDIFLKSFSLSKNDKCFWTTDEIVLNKTASKVVISPNVVYYHLEAIGYEGDPASYNR